MSSDFISGIRSSEDMKQEQEIILAKLKELEKEEKEMKKFLVIKTTHQQLKEGIEHPVDTAFIESVKGKLYLKAVFEVQQFKPEEISVQIADDHRLELKAQCLDDQENAVYRKTMIRNIDLPDTVDTSDIDCSMSLDGILTVTMPFHLPNQTQNPNGESVTNLLSPTPGAVPIVTGPDGRRYINLKILLGPDFTIDDVKVTSEDHTLHVRAWYEAEVGTEGKQVTRRELKKDFRLQENISIDTVSYDMTSQGLLEIVVLLEPLDEPYICYVESEPAVIKSDGLEDFNKK